MRYARLIAASLLSALPLSSLAADEKNKASATEDSVAASKRELDALKDDRLRSGQAPRVSLPTDISDASLPDTRLAPELEDARQKQRELMRRKAKSANWLVDGVQSNNGRTDSNKESDVPGMTKNETQVIEFDPVTGKPVVITVETAKPTDADKAHGDRGAADAKSLKEAPPENPLNRYMGEWMTARDYTLLKPTADAGPNARFDAPASDSVARSTPDAGMSLPGPMPPSRSLNSSLPMMPGGGGMARDNPYLQSLTLPAPSAATPFALDAGPAAMGPSGPPPQTSSFGPPASISDSKTTSPLQENLKRSDDAKYFPQLKRF